MIPSLLLAAGQSRRMVGRDKLMEEVDGMPLLLRQARMIAALPEPAYVTLPGPDHPRSQLLEQDGPPEVERIWVPDATLGLSRSLQAGVAALPREVEGVLILLADLPDIEEADLRALLHVQQARPDADVWQAVTEDHLPGHPLILSARLFEDVAALDGDAGAGDLIRAAHKADRVEPVPLPGQRARTDLDTPAEWAAWRENNPER